MLVSTGLSSSAELLNEVHRSVVDQVEEAVADGVPADRRKALERLIRERAENPDPDADAELLGDDDAAG